MVDGCGGTELLSSWRVGSGQETEQKNSTRKEWMREQRQHPRTHFHDRPDTPRNMLYCSPDDLQAKFSTTKFKCHNNRKVFADKCLYSSVPRAYTLPEAVSRINKPGV